MITKKELSRLQAAEGLSSDELAEVILCCDVCSYKKGEAIIKEHSLASDMFIIEKGSVSVQVEMSGDNEPPRMKELAVLERGEIFGEMAFLEEWRRSACVIAKEDAAVVKLVGERLHELFEKDARIGYKMMRNLGLILARRLMDTNYHRRVDSEKLEACES